MIEKDEAIELLCAYGTPLDEEKFQEALNMAITALSADGDLVSRKAVLEIFGDVHPLDYNARAYVKQIEGLPTIPQTDYENYEAFGWCKGCKEYDTEKHCCHRYSSFIRETLQDNINAVLEDIKTEILKHMLDEPPEDGTNGEMCCYNNGLFFATEIIDSHISGKEQE